MRRPLVIAMADVLRTGCSDDETDACCVSVKDHRVELSDIVASTHPGANFDGLDAHPDPRDDARPEVHPGSLPVEQQGLDVHRTPLSR